MTVSTDLSHEEYVGNGVTTDFDFRFRIFESNHLIVVVADSDGNETTLKDGTDYTIIGAGSYHGGKVVLNKPLAKGWKILLERDLPVVQETDLRNQGKFFAEVHEYAFDYLTMLIQKAFSILRLCLRKPTFLSKYYDAENNRISNLGDAIKPCDAVNLKSMSDELKKTLRVNSEINVLPDIPSRKNKVVAFDSHGQPIMIDPFEASPISDAVTKSSAFNHITDGQLRIGTEPVANASNRDTLLLSRKIRTLSDRHGFRDESVLDEIIDYGGYGSFDVATTFRGTGRDEKGFDHHYAYQNRFNWEGTTNIGTIGGYLGRVNLTGSGTVQRILDISIEDYKGDSPTKEHYGIRIRALEKAERNYSFVSEGENASMIHAGVATFGFPLVPPTGERGIHYGGTSLKGVAQVGIQSSGAANSDAILSYAAFLSKVSVLSGVNLPDGYHLKIENGGKGSGALIQRYTGISIENLNLGESNRAYQSLIEKSDKNWNLFIHGDAQNYLAGNLGIGNNEVTRNPKARLHLLGGTNSTPVIKLEQGVLLDIPSNGCFEFEGTALFFTIKGERYKVNLTKV